MSSVEVYFEVIPDRDGKYHVRYERRNEEGRQGEEQMTGPFKTAKSARLYAFYNLGGKGVSLVKEVKV